MWNALRVRNKAVAALVLASPFVAASMSYACVKPSHVVSALEAAEVACILIHESVDDEHALAKACNISDALVPEVRKILFARKAAEKQKAASAASTTACPPASSASSTSASASATASASAHAVAPAHAASASAAPVSSGKSKSKN
jgi:hypothetical protein